MNRTAFAVAQVLLPPVSWGLCASGGNGRIASIETKNKFFIIETVEFADHFLGGSDLDLEEHVRRINAVEPFRRLWLEEGIGLHYGFKAIRQSESVRNLLNEGSALKIPVESLLLVHAGMSMAFVRHFLEKLKPAFPAGGLSDALQRIVQLLKDNSRPGYLGESFEALGMVTRFFYGRARFDASLAEVAKLAPDYVPHVWHGAGRALYFVSFIPTFGEPWPALKLIDKEAHDEVSRRNLIAGLFSAIMMVNMRVPEVMEALFRCRVAKFPPADAEAVGNGVVCSTIFRNEATPGEKNMQLYAQHEPAPDIADLWNRLVRTPMNAALSEYQPVLKQSNRLDAVCCFQPMGPLVAKLKAGLAAT